MTRSVIPAVKICGLTDPDDAAAAAAAGAAFVGAVLSPGFGRSLSLSRARDVLDGAADCRRVGVFVDAPRAAIEKAIEVLELAVVQLHGEETRAGASALRAAGVRVWKAVRPREAGDVRDAVQGWTDVADGLLLDGFSPTAPGGSGTRFDWSLAASEWPPGPGPRRIVAGGLDASNVATAIALLAPDVVDVSSGVEAEPGRKDPARIARFLAAVRDEMSGHATPAVPDEASPATSDHATPAAPDRAVGVDPPGVPG